jgi:ABC-type multidrug transport system fused ATPase/permease subunit
MSIASLQPMGIWKSYIKKYPGHAVLQGIFTLVYPIQALFNPIKFAKVVQSVQERKGLGKSLLVLVGVNFIFLLFNRASLSLTSDMNVTMQAHVISEVLSYMFKSQRFQPNAISNGRMISMIASYASQLTRYLGQIQQGVIPTVVSLLLQTIYLLSIDKLLATCVLGIAVAASVAFGTASTTPKAIHANMYEFVDEFLLNQESVINHDSYDYEMEKLSAITKITRDAKKHANRVALRMATIMNVVLVAIISIYTTRLHVILQDGKDDLKEATTAITILLEVVRRSERMLETIYQLTNTRVSMKVSMRELNLLSHKPPNSIETTLSNTNPEAVLEAVKLNKGVIRDLSIQIMRGNTTSIIGNGKTTLLKLLAGKTQPMSGGLFFQGVSYADVHKLHCKLGYVSQSSILFDQSLRENLMYGATDLDLEKELQTLSLLPYFQKIGLDTRVGKRGSRLSLSQCKMVLFVRVVVQNPQVLIVDDPTAGLSDDIAKIVMKIITSRTSVFATNDKHLASQADVHISI